MNLLAFIGTYDVEISLIKLKQIPHCMKTLF